MSLAKSSRVGILNGSSKIEIPKWMFGNGSSRVEVQQFRKSKVLVQEMQNSRSSEFVWRSSGVLRRQYRTYSVLRSCWCDPQANHLPTWLQTQLDIMRELSLAQVTQHRGFVPFPFDRMHRIPTFSLRIPRLPPIWRNCCTGEGKTRVGTEPAFGHCRAACARSGCWAEGSSPSKVLQFAFPGRPHELFDERPGPPRVRHRQPPWKWWWMAFSSSWGSVGCRHHIGVRDAL